MNYAGDCYDNRIADDKSTTGDCEKIRELFEKPFPREYHRLIEYRRLKQR